MTALYIILALVLGIALGYLFSRQQSMRHEHELQHQLLNDFSEKERQLQVQQQEALNAVTAQKAEADSQKAVAQALLKQAEQHNEQLRQEAQQQAQTQRKLLQEELKTMTEQVLRDARNELNNTDQQRLDALLTPLKEKLETFTKSVNDNSTKNEANKAEIKSVFETLVQQFKADQEKTVSQLREQTERIGNDAANLTRALKGDSKMQGDWGEMILEQTLTDYGLVKDLQFFLQPNFKDAAGNNLRPDAVICFPGEERVVIDSKVSLTAYTDAMATNDEAQRQQHMKQHVASVKKHIDELSAKHYDKVVPNSIGYVLMFMPYEGGYAAAIKADNTLMQYAYQRHIIILSPANLLVTLTLTRIMWQNYNINRNSQEILTQATALYDKFAGFAESFTEINKHLTNAQKTYNTSLNRLKEGKGNIVSRLNKMKQLGINPNKQLPEVMNNEEEDDVAPDSNNKQIAQNTDNTDNTEK